MSIEFRIYGTRGGFPVYDRNFSVYGNDTSCYVIKDGNYAIVLDCGSGLIKALDDLKNCPKIDIILSHVHYDHVIGLLEHTDLYNHNVTFYGDFINWRNDESKNKNGSLIHIDEIIKSKKENILKDKEYKLNNNFIVSFVPSRHPDHAYMVKVKKGKKRICYTSDYECNFAEMNASWAKNCDLLVIDGAYTKEEYQDRRGHGHSSIEDAMAYGKNSKAKMVLITHHYYEHDDEFLTKKEEEVRKEQANCLFAKQGARYEV